MVYRTEGRPQPNEYFTDGEGIEREVIQSNIPLYLGSEATVRPTEYNVRSTLFGGKITIF